MAIDKQVIRAAHVTESRTILVSEPGSGQSAFAVGSVCSFGAVATVPYQER